MTLNSASNSEQGYLKKPRLSPKAMLTCEICGEEVVLEEDMKTHLLLSHMENEMSCPLCSLSGVSYDELSFHISTAHPEHHGRRREEGGGNMAVKPRPSPTNTRTDSKHDRRLSESSKGGVANRNSSRDRFDTVGAGVSLRRTSNHNTPLSQEDSVVVVTPAPRTTPVYRGTLVGGTAPVSGATSAGTRPTGSPRTRTGQGSGRDGEAEETAGGVRAEYSKAKQKRLSSPRKEKRFPCPMCALVCSDCLILQEHVELHLQEQSMTEEAVLGAMSSSSAEASPSSSSSSGVKTYECPLCSLMCADSASLQEHVELHLDYGTATAAGSPVSDLRLARRLQEEEEQKRKEQEVKQEAEEFKKLQRQFGLDSSGGYRRQMEKTMEKAVSRGHMVPADFHTKRAEMMESLASGVDDGRTRTQGVLGALYECYQREANKDCAHVWLCADTDHYCSSAGDKGWGCGYRNFQMLLSSLNRLEPYAACLSEGSVPSIPRVQTLIEGAWREGLDPQGASHFNRRLQGTRAWIGATEIYALFTSLRVSARIIDFHKPSGPGDTHPRLFEWVKQYFSVPASRGARLPPRVVQTSQPPLYLQHQGHSRSIVGVEQRKNGSLCLLILDPGCSPADMRKLLDKDGTACATAVRRMRKFPGNLKHKQYQMVAVEGVLTPEEKQTRIVISRTLCAERIP